MLVYRQGEASQVAAAAAAAACVQAFLGAEAHSTTPQAGAVHQPLVLPVVCFLIFCLLADAGWQNRLTGEGSGSVFDIFVGAGKADCTKGGDVGNMTVSCTNVSGSANVTFSNFVQQAAGDVLPSSHFYVGCSNITKCGPPQFMSQAAGDVPCTPNTQRCGGNVNASTLFVGPGQTYTLNCSCASVRWAFHQSGSFFVQGPAPAGNICPK